MFDFPVDLGVADDDGGDWDEEVDEEGDRHEPRLRLTRSHLRVTPEARTDVLVLGHSDLRRDAPEETFRP